MTDNNKLEDVQIEIDSVVNDMKNNVEKILERGSNIGELEDKSEALRESSQRFNLTSRRLKNVLWWENCKSKWFLVIVFLVILAVLGIILGITLSNK